MCVALAYRLLVTVLSWFALHPPSGVDVVSLAPSPCPLSGLPSASVTTGIRPRPADSLPGHEEPPDFPAGTGNVTGASSGVRRVPAMQFKKGLGPMAVLLWDTAWSPEVKSENLHTMDSGVRLETLEWMYINRGRPGAGEQPTQRRIRLAGLGKRPGADRAIRRVRLECQPLIGGNERRPGTIRQRDVDAIVDRPVEYRRDGEGFPQ